MGFGRLMLLAFLFGNATRQAEMFTIANTVPNSMYILLAGGVLNTVLVPQIVRAIKGDADGGEAYTNRIMTAGLIGAGLITIVLTALVPVDHLASTPPPAGSRRAVRSVRLDDHARLLLHAAGLLLRRVRAGRAGTQRPRPVRSDDVGADRQQRGLDRGPADLPRRLRSRQHRQAFTTGEELLLGLGSTLGIAVQAAVLVPFLRAAGYRYRPRFDFRHTGLGKTFRLAKWTLGFVLVNQLALVVINRLASGATVGGSGAGLASLLQRACRLDPAALADHGLAGHGHAARRLAAGRGRRPGRGGG